MAKFNYFCGLVGKKKEKGNKEPLKKGDRGQGLKTLQVKLEQADKSSPMDEEKLTSFNVSVPFGVQGNSRCNVKVMSHESPINEDAAEAEIAYEGEDEHDENLSMRRDYSDLDLQARIGDPNEDYDQLKAEKTNLSSSYEQMESRCDKDGEEDFDMVQGGHVSDPGIGKAEFWASPKLKRSCSNLETGDVLKKIADQLPPSKYESYDELQRLTEREKGDVNLGNFDSPRSATSHCSADKVMLKKHSSSQILPSRSRRLWWKLYLWSHRNLQAPRSTAKLSKPIFKPAINQQGGYSSDTLEPNRFMELGKLKSPLSFSGELSNRGGNNDNQSWDGFHSGASGLWPQNQWVAFPPESPLTRVDEWVKELATQPPVSADDDGGIVFPPSPDNGKSQARSMSLLSKHPNMHLPEEIVHANAVIHSLNSSSTVAHISGMGLKVIPTISHFSSLRSVNLSSNFIVHVAAGSLPKGLHTLNLSRNKITTIEGLRELTRLRVLDLSYNRISRIGQGLSNCTLIKELYLAGNKISDVEGLHRLLKLTVLDLSFNKITTTKSLGQLVANYNSLLALNLCGNPIQNNISDDQLRKGVCSLLPKLAFLNKQPVNPQKAREMATEGITKAALGNNSWNSRRKTTKRVNLSGSTSSTLRRSGASTQHKSRHRLRSSTHHQSPLKTKSSAVASSSHQMFPHS